MKKLILLTVVVFGFAATSLAQKDASTSVQVQFQIATSPNAGASIGWSNDMDFAKIDYNKVGGYIWIKPTTTAVATLPVIGTPKPATFYIKGLKSGTPNLSVTPSTSVDLGNYATFETSSDPNYLNAACTDGGQGNYTVKLGGKLTLPDNFVGTISIPSVTVAINNQ